MTADELMRQGLAAHQAGRLDETRAIYEQVLAVDPRRPDALHYLGLLLSHLGDFGPALDLMERALALRPDVPQFHANLGNALRACDRRTEAAERYHAALRLKPDSPIYRLNLGNTLWELGRLDEALSALEEAAQRAPDSAAVHNGLGLVYKDLGRLDEAISSLQRAVELDPSLIVAASGWLYALNYQPSYSPEQIFAEHRQWAAAHADPLTAVAPANENDPTPERRLRVGYVSSCFRDHAVNFFVEPLLKAHDRDAFEVFCYSDVVCPDDVTRRLQTTADRWQSLVGLNAAAVAELIRHDGIDILVDLNGHMGAHRLLAFARRPAPVQATYIGYQATTGMAAMDYRLTDAHADPPGQTDAWHTEKLVRLPESFFCYEPPAECPDVVPPPCLTSGEVTFGSFNAFAKVTSDVLSVWAEILRQTPGSKLNLIVPQSASLVERVRRLMSQDGISPNRIVFVPRAARSEYLLAYQRVDIALDPFPFNGHTTTCDALWMGVPVIAMCGRRYVERYGGTAIVALGLADFLATSCKDYIAAAVRLARDSERLAEIRAALRQRMAESALCDASGFAAKVEAAYRQMWKTWCSSKRLADST
jgi:predicted O-linked N-acetylglucosamine transferase (SPINDLY family)